jgi:glycosidase
MQTDVNNENLLKEEVQDHKLVVYQMFTRLFGNTKTTNKVYGTKEENGVGTFKDITPKALEELKKLGVTHVWYTGVIEHATMTDYTRFNIPLDDADVIKGRAGSPYAIKDYYDVNPDLATDVPNRMKEFEELIQRTHAAGLKVIIDFVPNHVARSYHSDAKPAGVKDLGENDDTSKSFVASNNFYYLPGTSFVVPQDYKPLGNLPHPTKDGKFNETPAKVTGNDQFTNAPGITNGLRQ